MFTTGKLLNDYIPTVFDNYKSSITVDGIECELSLWDTAGQRDYDRLRPLNYRGADLFIIGFSVCSLTSYQNIIHKWIPEVKHHCSKVPFIICCTKIDLRDDKKWCDKNIISFEDGLRLAKKYEQKGCKGYVECSSITKEGIYLLFETAVRVFWDYDKKSKPRSNSTNIFKIASNWLGDHGDPYHQIKFRVEYPKDDKQINQRKSVKKDSKSSKNTNEHDEKINSTANPSSGSNSTNKMKLKNTDQLLQNIKRRNFDSDEEYEQFKQAIVAAMTKKETEEKKAESPSLQSSDVKGFGKIPNSSVTDAVPRFSVLSSEDILQNPYVVIIGIDDYNSNYNEKLPNLPGVKQDIYKMAYLWNKIYGYKNVSIGCNYSSKDNSGNNNVSEEKSSRKDKEIEHKLEQEFGNIINQNKVNNGINFGDYLVKIRSGIDFLEKNDGLIFYYSGHGIKNKIILANGKRYWIKDIISTFDGKSCVHLRDKPKVFIFDCCRGNDIAETYDVNKKKDKAIVRGHANNNDNDNNNSNNQWADVMYHKNSGFAMIFANFENYSINDSDHGGCLTTAVETTFGKPELIEQVNLRDLILVIRQQTKLNAGKGNAELGASAQLVDFHETLEKKIYFRSNKS